METAAAADPGVDVLLLLEPVPTHGPETAPLT